MKLKGKNFKAVVATPALGKSYLADNYSDFVDVDELRLFAKYIIPEGITRQELEQTKANRPFPKRENYEELFIKNLDKAVAEGKILICSPHMEIKEYLMKNKIPYLFVYPGRALRKQIKQRMIDRGNSDECVKANDEMFYTYNYQNKFEPYAICRYRIKKDEYLSDVLKKAGLDFDLLHKKENKV